MKGRVVVAGSARGPLLRLSEPISFWGGVDGRSGTIADPRHPECGASVSGTVLAIPFLVGSSSSSAIMLELLREGTAPAAILLGQVDAILALGVLVGGELGYPTVPVVKVDFGEVENLVQGGLLFVGETGLVVADNSTA